MADVRYQYRGIGLLPPDLAGWLDYYVRNRLPIAMEEWKQKVAAAEAAGEIGENISDWIKLLSKLAETSGGITEKDINYATAALYGGAKVSGELIKANASRFGWRTKASIETMRQKMLNIRQSREFRNDMVASLQITSNELNGINDLARQAKSAYDNSPGGTERDRIRNAIKIASEAAAATAAGLADKNTIHASAYMDRAARDTLTALGVQGEALAEANEAVREFFYQNHGVPYAQGADGTYSFANSYADDPLIAPIMEEAYAKEPGAGARDESIPDLREYDIPMVSKVEGDTVTPVAATPEQAASLVQSSEAATAGQQAAPAGAVPSQQVATRSAADVVPPPPAGFRSASGVVGPGGFSLPDAAQVSNVGTGVGAAGRQQASALTQYAMDQIAREQARAIAAKASGATEIPPFRLAPEPGPNPKQAQADAIKARLDAMRKNNPEAYERFRHLAGEVKRSQTPDSAIKADTRENALDKIVKDKESPEFSTGPMETTPSEHAADFGRRSSADFARLKAAQLDAGIADTPEGKEERMKFLQDRAAALALMSPAQRKAFGSSFTADDESWNTVNTMVQERVRGAAKAKAAQPPGMFDAPEEAAKLDKALEKAAASGPTPNDVRERSRWVAEQVYNAAYADAESSDRDFAGAFADAIKMATEKPADGVDVPTLIRDFKDIWKSDERPGPQLALRKTGAALRGAFGVTKEPPAGTPKVPPPMPGAPAEQTAVSGGATVPVRIEPAKTGLVVPSMSAAIPVSNAAVGGVVNPAVGGVVTPPPAPFGTVTGLGSDTGAWEPTVLAYPETDEENEVYDYLTESWKEANPKAAGESDDTYHARAVGEATKLFQNYKATEASP